MKEYGFGSKNEVIEKKDLTLEKLKKALKSLCDEDFNGVNGENYYIPVKDKTGNTLLKSRFDVAWEEIVKEDTNPSDKGWDIADTILNEAYSYDSSYYIEYTVEVINTPDAIIIFIAYMNCV